MGICIDSLRRSLIAIPLLVLASSFHSASAGLCDVSYFDGRQIFNFSFTAPIAGFPHGILSEDGYTDFLKSLFHLLQWAVSVSMFLHSLCSTYCFTGYHFTYTRGSGCSALVANNIGGYEVCSTIGGVSNTSSDIMDKQNPQKGVIVKISSLDTKENCSLSVSVICNSSGLTVRKFFLWKSTLHCIFFQIISLLETPHLVYL
ncbi:unnamed protein product [Linum tenue]|uniref:Uncharacterized protein n=1 Tax=Linum tenue TaxID=586396 RepID=A0AAV0MCU2_9ROSI|nr:unnamed protein product [Linum tenue]